MKLSTHFSLDEFVFSQTATRKGIKNIPDQSQIKNMINLCLFTLEPIREHYGMIIITSGFRCPALNYEINGSVSSQHLFGEAADIISPKYSISEMFKWIITKSNILYDQIIYEGEWIHISYTNRYENRLLNTVATFYNGIATYANYEKEQIEKLNL